MRPGSDEGAFTKIIDRPTQTTSTTAFTSTSTEASISEVTIQDFLQTSGGVPTVELSKIASTSSTPDENSNPLLSVLPKSDKISLPGVDPLELELLSRISGTHRDQRPHRLHNNRNGGGEAPNVRFESSRTFESSRDSATPKTSTQRIQSVFEEEPRRLVRIKSPNSGFSAADQIKDKSPPRTQTTTSTDEMRLLEIQRIRDQRLKMAKEAEDEAEARRKEELEKETREKEERERINRQRELQRQKEREEERLLELERQRILQQRKEEERIAELLRREEVAKKRREEEAARLEKKRQEEKRAKEAEDRRKQLKREEKMRREEEERRKKEEEERLKRIKAEEEFRKKQEEERRKKQEEEERRKKTGRRKNEEAKGRGEEEETRGRREEEETSGRREEEET